MEHEHLKPKDKVVARTVSYTHLPILCRRKCPSSKTSTMCCGSKRNRRRNASPPLSLIHIFLRLYEDMVAGRISEANFNLLMEKTQKEQAEVHILDDEAASRAYIEQVWAEAMTTYKSGDFKLSFTPEMIPVSYTHLAGLILRVRQGFGEPNKIYVLIPKKEDSRL